jgi:hypothetical protein
MNDLKFRPVQSRSLRGIASLAAAALLSALVGAAHAAEQPPTLLVISIDGLRPDYVSKAAEHGLKLPFLRQLWRDGARATGVRGALPTLTYPSHTTLITGAAPARHGIYFNRTFDLEGDPSDLYWYAEDVRVPTVWQAASAAGRTVGSISWPVTAGAVGIHYNIPEHFARRSDEDVKIVRAMATPGLMAELEKVAGPYLTDVNQALERDWARMRYARELIRTRPVDFLTVHFTATDYFQHQHGPFTDAARVALEAADEMVRVLARELRARDPNAVVAIVSDHGFSRVDQQVSLDAAFVEAGLISLRSRGDSLRTAGVKDWIAIPWPCGGSAAVILKNPDDAGARTKVLAVLERLAADPMNAIGSILERSEIARQGGSPMADFWVGFKPGTAVSAFLAGPLARAVTSRGTHGFLPEYDDMLSAFFIAGPGIAPGRDLGIIDMRSIAPTLASVMRVPFPSAELPPLEITYNSRN